MKLLPRSIRDLVAQVGISPALALVNAFAGQVIQVPQKTSIGGQLSSRLVRTMGKEAAEIFIKHHGGGFFNVPRCVQAMRAVRNAEIVEAYSRGTSVRVLLTRHGLTQRQIYAILKMPVPEGTEDITAVSRRSDNQFSLF